MKFSRNFSISLFYLRIDNMSPWNIQSTFSLRGRKAIQLHKNGILHFHCKVLETIRLKYNHIEIAYRAYEQQQHHHHHRAGTKCEHSEKKLNWNDTYKKIHAYANRELGSERKREIGRESQIILFALFVHPYFPVDTLAPANQWNPLLSMCISCCVPWWLLPFCKRASKRDAESAWQALQ